MLALKEEPNSIGYSCGDGCDKCDMKLLHFHLCFGGWNVVEKRHELSLLEELEKRGYDMSTFKFSVRKKHD